MNVSGTVNALRLFYNPWQFLPQITVSTFNQIPIPIPSANGKKPIRVVILDKDNCFAEPHKNVVWPEYEQHFAKLKEAYPDGVLIVSNTAGSGDDVGYKQAELLEQNTGIKVLHHTSKKPGCHSEIMDYLRTQNLATDASEVAVVGDRLMTDVLMANLMGSTSVWIRDGVVPPTSVLSRVEYALYDSLANKDQK
ncbi:Gep4p [Sugiyamaella lignohabitans]|uniref:Gep4p n=1 Tax=Sugiyamaella lignohabitans TaxID=796027 RepID=A0A167EEL5_9ASCO|nr:Gep4p [Sugiyamaella lignohabitans]ANB13978.1 Gep4p [Sugiyamaella lignohabitans]